MNQPIANLPEAAFFLLAFLIFAGVAVAPRRTLRALFFRQRAVATLSEGRVRTLRVLAGLSALALLAALAWWGMFGTPT